MCANSGWIISGYGTKVIILSETSKCLEIQMAVNFYIDKRPNKQGEVAVRCSISIQGKRLTTTAGFSIKPEYWDSPSQRVLSSFGGKAVVNSKGISAKMLNAKLKKIDSFFSDLENALWTNHEKVGNLKDIYKDEFGREKPADSIRQASPGFYSVLDKFRDESAVQNDWSVSTIKKFKTLRNHLVDFNNDLSFEDLTESGLNLFMDFLREDCDFRNSTALKTLKQLKWFLRWAVKHNYCKETSFEAFKPKLKTTEKKIIFLDWDELIKVYNYKFPEIGKKINLIDPYGNKYEKVVAVGRETLEHVRDLFCFCCFTGLRYSDAANLKRSNVFQEHINVTTIKTYDLLKIELNNYARAILDKYKETKFPYDRVLPVLSNQRTNEYLKEMCEICGLNSPETDTYYKGNQRFDEVHPKWSLIGTHTGRRTFICNALMLGISPQVVMKWTGHNDYKAMQPYIDITDAAKAKAMKKFNKKSKKVSSSQKTKPSKKEK